MPETNLYQNNAETISAHLEKMSAMLDMLVAQSLATVNFAPAGQRTTAILFVNAQQKTDMLLADSQANHLFKNGAEPAVAAGHLRVAYSAIFAPNAFALWENLLDHDRVEIRVAGCMTCLVRGEETVWVQDDPDDPDDPDGPDDGDDVCGERVLVPA